jgi:spore coat polysaccharide biosynthesis predicted glycosyltransferase SpsG
MRFVFRADASLAIGSGHVMRSSAIAEEVIARGFPAVFVGTISELPWVKEHIHSLGFADFVIETRKFSSDSIEDVLILDSYVIPVSESFIQPPKWRSIVNIFDESTPQYKCDLKIHPGLTRNWQQISNIPTFSGPAYTPLRKSIKKLGVSQGDKNIEIVVVGGGVDLTQFVLAIANVLSESKEKFHANLFMSSASQHNLDLDSRFSIFPIGKNLDQIANKANLVFTTASTTSLEFLARGAAVAIGCSVKNQELYFKELSSGNYAAPVGEFSNNQWNLDIHMIHQLINSEEFRNELIANCTELIDLYGAKRIVDEILNL